MSVGKRGLCLIFGLILLLPKCLQAEWVPMCPEDFVRLEQTDFVCNGWVAPAGRWGRMWTCPDGWAIFSNDDPAGVNGPAARITASVECCQVAATVFASPLQHVFVDEQCPDDYIGTGFEEARASGGQYKMRCTLLNTAQYKLGPVSPAYYWGNGASGWKNGTKLVNISEINPALREALGWWNAQERDQDGCVGYPYGSFLTKKSCKHCGCFGYRPLLKRENSDPVQVLPSCSAIQNAHTQNPICVP